MLIGSGVLWGYIVFLSPSTTRTNILQVLSLPIVSATVPNPYLLESQTHLIEMVALLRRCPEFQSALLVFLPSQKWLAAL